MVKVIKYPWDARNTIFFSSDWHVFHDPSWEVPIWKARGYSSAEDHAEEVLATINSRVGENDTLYFLGDMFLNATDGQCMGWLSRIKCQNIIKLWGNHHSNMYRLYKQVVKDRFAFIDDDTEVYPIRMNNVVFMGNHVEIRVGKQHVSMNHFPQHSWNHMGPRAKSWCLSGHSHNSDRTRNPDSPTNRCLDCSWDWKKDVWSWAEIEDVMSTKTFVAVDHHKST